MVRDDDEACAVLAHQLEAKATELEARQRATRLWAAKEATRRRDESAARALKRLDELARWRERLSTRAAGLHDGREIVQPMPASILKSAFRIALMLWLGEAVWSGAVRVSVGLVPLAVLWVALFVELRR